MPVNNSPQEVPLDLVSVRETASAVGVTPSAPADAVAIYEALRHTNVSRRHIVAWVTQGWLASWQGRYGRLVLVEDVQALAQQNAVSAPAAGDSTPLPPHPERES